MRTTISLGIAAGLLMLGCGGPPDVETTLTDLDIEPAAFDDLDRDGDDNLDAEEFYGATEVYYDVLDMDQDGRLTDRELSDGLFGVWDANRDGRLSERELDRGAVAWFPAGVDTDFRAWDDNDDFEIDRAEFHAGLERERVLSSWDGDGDGQVTDLELTGAMFETWDMDRSSGIDALEWRFD